MKVIVALVILSLVAAVSASANIPEESRFLFSSWAQQHGKTYSSPAETEHRLQIFHDNLQFIKAHNALAAQGLKSFTVGTNKFADLTVEEYRATYLKYRPSFSSNRNATTVATRTVGSNPASIDWREKGFITGVKDQGQCGSCWSFSTTGAVEGAWNRAHSLTGNSQVVLSEQNLIDCVKDGSYTCDTGGEMQDGFQYIIDNGGIDTEDSYPYCTCSGNQCQYNSANSAATISSFGTVTEGSESDLETAAANHAGVSVAIDASQQSFQLYTSGVYDEPACSSTQLDHGVLVVGYGTESGEAYWIVKNSWSASWGDNGYILMSRNKKNQCGIATDASYPVV